MNSKHKGRSGRQKDQVKSKLRAVDVSTNLAACKIGLQIYRNMEVPAYSCINDAFDEIFSYPGMPSQCYAGWEQLNWWKHSGGALSDMRIRVAAKRFGKRVYALISPNHESRQDK